MQIVKMYSYCKLVKREQTQETSYVWHQTTKESAVLKMFIQML